jgi:hypothetical protein
MNQQRTRRFLSAYISGITDKIGRFFGDIAQHQATVLWQSLLLKS